MRVALLAMIGIGTTIGFAMPGARPRAVAPLPSPTVAATTPAPTVMTEADEVRRDTVIERSPGGHFVTVANVNDEPIRFVVDTGASIVALTQDDARRAGVAFDPSQFDMVARGASGPVRGQEVMLKDVVLDGKRVDDVHAVVLDGLDVSLLGQNYLRHLDTVSISGDRMTLR